MKKQIKKLNLNKSTITNLYSEEMNRLAGGDKTNGKGNTCTKCQSAGTFCTAFCTYTCTQSICGGGGACITA